MNNRHRHGSTRQLGKHFDRLLNIPKAFATDAGRWPHRHCVDRQSLDQRPAHRCVWRNKLRNRVAVAVSPLILRWPSTLVAQLTKARLIDQSFVAPAIVCPATATWWRFTSLSCDQRRQSRTDQGFAVRGAKALPAAPRVIVTFVRTTGVRGRSLGSRGTRAMSRTTLSGLHSPKIV